MRTGLTVLLLTMLCASVGAQSHADRARSTDEPWRPSIGLPLPQIGLPLAPIGLPLPSMGLPPQQPPRVHQPERPEQSQHGTRGRASRGAAFVFFPSFGWPYPFLPESEPAASSLVPPYPVRPLHATGTLRIELQSGVDPQIFIDGYYVGLYSDALGGELIVDAGAHTLELHEDGYDPLHADIQVPQDGTISYRANLKWTAPPLAPVLEEPKPPSPPPAPTTIYVIPGCYVGNVTPRDALLPAGCDPANAVEFPPAH